MKNQKFKILLVEDNEATQQATKLILTYKFGCEVAVASSGEEALQMASENNYDLIFMDIGLPGIDGIETTQKIRSPEGLNHKTPVVALTAHTDDNTRQKCVNIGMNEYLAKPFNNSEMKEILIQFGLLVES